MLVEGPVLAGDDGVDQVLWQVFYRYDLPFLVGEELGDQSALYIVYLRAQWSSVLEKFSELLVLLVAAMATPVQTPITTATATAIISRIRAAFAGLESGDMRLAYAMPDVLVNGLAFSGQTAFTVYSSAGMHKKGLEAGHKKRPVLGKTGRPLRVSDVP